MSVRHALLALLSEEPKYGQRLREEFEAGTGEVWPLNIGQVYTTMQRLERDGLIESDDDDQESPQKRFKITADGELDLAHLGDPAEVGEKVVRKLRAGMMPPKGMKRPDAAACHFAVCQPSRCAARYRGRRHHDA